MPHVCGGDSMVKSRGLSWQGSVAREEGRGQELDAVGMQKGQRSGSKVIAIREGGRKCGLEG